MLDYQSLFQRPYFFESPAFAIQPNLAAEIGSIRCLSDEPCFRYETLMLESPRDYGQGLKESGVNCGFGASFHNPAEALAKSIFEAWERKSSKQFDPAELVTGTQRSLGSATVSPAEFALVSDWEYRQSPLPYVRYSPDLPLSWKECFRIRNRSLEKALIPATLVYSRFSWKYPEQRFVPTLSPGLACHHTFKEAFLTGLCELIERDAFMLAWLHRASPKRIDPGSIDFREAGAAMEYLHSRGYLVHFFNLTTDLDIPVVLTLIEHPELAWSGTLVPGLGCDLDTHAALRKALLEALVMLANHVTDDLDRSALVVQQRTLPFGLQAADYYQNVRFLLAGDEQSSIQKIAHQDRNEPGRNLEFLIDHLNARGHATYFVDLTPPGYDNCRLCLTRAFISGLQPMLYEPDCWRLNPKRLFGDGPAEFERLNLMPHPLMLME